MDGWCVMVVDGSGRMIWYVMVVDGSGRHVDDMGCVDCRYDGC